MATPIDNPILNSPFEEPSRHFAFDDDGITSEVARGRRESVSFIPIPPPKKKAKQASFEFMGEKVNKNVLVNRVRGEVSAWRAGGWHGATETTKALLRFWTEREENRLFFAQIEALETAIFVAEVAATSNRAWVTNEIRAANEGCNPGLFRVAFKMATGAGKTVIMAMLIAWQTLNKLAKPKDRRFASRFLIVTPGVTIRDRLRVLLPNDPQNYYKQRGIVPEADREKLLKATIVLTNYHAFRLRETLEASALTKKIVRGRNPAPSPFTETPDQMVRRVCGDLFGPRGVSEVIVLNDEAHHCYRRKPSYDDGEALVGEDRTEAEKRNDEARLWITGIEAVEKRLGVKTVFDLSATPFFLRGSGWSEGTIFPWVVSDFSLIDAIEAGIVKVPRVPIADNTMTGDLPVNRDLWARIRDHLPRKGRKTEAVGGEPRLPAELEGALNSLYRNYARSFEDWAAKRSLPESQATPPVFIVVCNNTNVSKLVYDHVAGYTKAVKGADGAAVDVLVPGKLPLFSNVADGRWLHRPMTVLIDSEQLESGDAMNADFKKMAAQQIEEFKNEYRARYPGRDAERLTDEDLLREVMNTVGKPGKLGEHVRCVVSVSMLTEGWDANTVTHVLGVRAFGTQLLCEQVVGRALRRVSYLASPRATADGEVHDTFVPEYAEVYGVPFSFIPASGGTEEPPPLQPPTRVRALPERAHLEIRFPNVWKYGYDLPREHISANFGPDAVYELTTSAVPTWTENAPIVGLHSEMTLDDYRKARESTIAFHLTRHVLETFFRETGEATVAGAAVGSVPPWMFPPVLDITRRWLRECVVCRDDTFPQMLLISELARTAADKIYRSIVRGTSGDLKLRAFLRHYNEYGSTRHVDFLTRRPTWRTRADLCHVSHVVADTESWEQKVAQALEAMDDVVAAYVKNDRSVGFTIPYSFQGDERSYYPDFIARARVGPALLNIVLEVSGHKREDKKARVETARALWIPAVNNLPGGERWAFVEILDPWRTQAELRRELAAMAEEMPS